MKRRLILSRCARRILYPLLGFYVGVFLLFCVSLFAMFRHATLAPGEVKILPAGLALVDGSQTYALKGDTFSINPCHGQYLVPDHGRIYLVPPAYFWPEYLLFAFLPLCATVLVLAIPALILSGHIRTEPLTPPVS